MSVQKLSAGTREISPGYFYIWDKTNPPKVYGRGHGVSGKQCLGKVENWNKDLEEIPVLRALLLYPKYFPKVFPESSDK